MKIWILQTGEPLPGDEKYRRPMRAINLAEAFIKKGHQVVIWSSNFDHFKKSFRRRKGHLIQETLDVNMELRLIQSSGYKRNIGFRRLFDHFLLAWNLNVNLKNEDPPDFAFIGYPPIETSLVMANWLKSRKVRFVLDVKDAWPDILERAFPTYFKSLAKLFLLPFNIASSRVFRISPGIVSISEEFLDWCLRKAKRPSSKYDFVLPLVTTFPKFESHELFATNKYWENLLKNSDKPIGLFVGSISEAFDFDSILCSVTQNQAIFVIAGSGTRYQQVKKKFYNFSNVFFPGDIDVKQYYSLAKFCNFYFAPYKKLDDFKMSVPNKFYDALFFGLPFITSLEGSTKKLIEEERVGVVFDINEPRSLVEALNYFSQKGIEELMSRNALKFYEKNYDSKRIYSDFVAQVLEPIKCN